MAALKHEVWRDAKGLPMCCLAGPDGEDARRLNGEGATLVWTFEASSHFDAMTAYYRFLDRGAYTTNIENDHEPYPEAWAERQRER